MSAPAAKKIKVEDGAAKPATPAATAAKPAVVGIKPPVARPPVAPRPAVAAASPAPISGVKREREEPATEPAADGTEVVKARDMMKLISMRKPKPINVVMGKLDTGERYLEPHQWSWDYIGLKKVQFNKAKKTRRATPYWILPDGKEAEPLLFSKRRHSKFGTGWNDEVPSFEKSARTTLAISCDLVPGEDQETILEDGDKWVLDRCEDLNEFIFGAVKSVAQIREDPVEGALYEHRMLKRGKTNAESGACYRNNWKQKIPTVELKDKEKKKVIGHDVDIPFVDAKNVTLKLDDVHRTECEFDVVSKFRGLSHTPSTRVTSTWEAQVLRFYPVKQRRDRFKLPDALAEEEEVVQQQTVDDSGRPDENAGFEDLQTAPADGDAVAEAEPAAAAEATPAPDEEPPASADDVAVPVHDSA